jgi:hypothetical protein
VSDGYVRATDGKVDSLPRRVRDAGLIRGVSPGSPGYVERLEDEIRKQRAEIRQVQVLLQAANKRIVDIRRAFRTMGAVGASSVTTAAQMAQSQQVLDELLLVQTDGDDPSHYAGT